MRLSARIRAAYARLPAATREHRSAVRLFLLNLIASGSSLLAFVMLARSMSVGDYGLYAYLLSIIGIGGTAAALGTPTLITREMARLGARRGGPQVSGLLAFGLAAISIGTLIVGGLLCSWREAGAASATPISARLAFAALIVLYLLQLRAFMTAALNGASEAVRGAIPVALGGFSFLAALAVLHLARFRLDPLAVLIIQGAATGLALLLQVRLLTKVLAKEIAGRQLEIQWRYWLGESLPFLGAGIAFTINAQIDVFLLGTLRGTGYTAIYQVGTKAASVLVLALGSVAAVYQPLLARAHFCADAAYLQRSSKTISRLGLLVAMAIAAWAVPLRSVLIARVFGSAYLQAGEVMSILILARLVNASVGAVGPYLGMTEKGRLLFLGLAAESVMNVALNLLLIPAYGIIGSAVATGSSMILMNVCMAIYIRRKFGISMFVV